VSDSGITLGHVEPLEVQRRGLSSGTRRMNKESLRCVTEPKSTQVYIRRNRSLGFRLRDNWGILSDKEDSGGVQASADALLASLLNAQLNSFSPARVTLYDPARFEVEINDQLSNDIGYAWAKDHSVAVSGPSKDFAVNLFSNYVPPRFSSSPGPIFSSESSLVQGAW